MPWIAQVSEVEGVRGLRTCWEGCCWPSAGASPTLPATCSTIANNLHAGPA